MRFVDLIKENKFAEAKEYIFERLDKLALQKIEEAETKVFDDLKLDEASRNIIKQGRTLKIRRRIRRNAKGRIIVQRNVRKSAIKGYRLSGGTVRRIPAIERIKKARKLKRYWKTKGRAKLTRTLMKRRMSIRRRKSMGIK